jgi:inorganic pyrophosphatase
MTDLTALPHQLDAKARTCRAVVECSQGARGKYAFDTELKGFTLKRLLPAGMSFPLDFGFVPSTQAEDGDPLDIMVLHDEPLPMGVILEVRLIGVVEAEQTEEGATKRNDRLLGVAAESLSYASTKTVKDLAPGFLDTITSFWTHYEALRGVGFKILGVKDGAEAVKRVKDTATES